MSTQMGGIWYTSGNWRWIIDPATDIGVLAEFADGTELVVTTTAHFAKMMLGETEDIGCDCEDLKQYNADCTAANYPELVQALSDSSDSEANKMLWQMILDGKTEYDFVLGLFASVEKVVTSEKMYIRIDLNKLDSNYDDSLEGQTVYVMAGVDDQIKAVKTSVEEGVVSIELDKLGMNEADFGYTQFVIVTEDAFNGVQGEETMADAEVVEFTGIPEGLPPFPEM